LASLRLFCRLYSREGYISAATQTTTPHSTALCNVCIDVESERENKKEKERNNKKEERRRRRKERKKKGKKNI
jgi:acyl-CoA hydrolase